MRLPWQNSLPLMLICPPSIHFHPPQPNLLHACGPLQPFNCCIDLLTVQGCRCIYKLHRNHRSTTDTMANMDDEDQAQADLLNWMQMEALGIKRREKIMTADFKENRMSCSTPHLSMPIARTLTIAKTKGTSRLFHSWRTCARRSVVAISLQSKASCR